MSASDMLPGFSQPPRGPRSWRVVAPGGQAKLITATAFRCEAGCAVFADPTGIVAALAPGAWQEILPADDVQPNSPSRQNA